MALGDFYLDPLPEPEGSQAKPLTWDEINQSAIRPSRLTQPRRTTAKPLTWDEINQNQRASAQYPVTQLSLEPLPSFQEDYGPVPRSTIEPAVKELTRQWQTPAGMEQRREEPPAVLEPFRKKFGLTALAPVEQKPSIGKRLALEVLPSVAAGLVAPFIPPTTASVLARVLPEPLASLAQHASVESMFRASGAITDIAQQEIIHRLVPTPAEQREINLNYYQARSLSPQLSSQERQEYQQKYRDLKAKPELTGDIFDVLRTEVGILDPLVLTRAAADTMIEWEGPFMQGLRAFHALGAVLGKGSKAGYRAVQAANAAVAGYFTVDQAKAGGQLWQEGRYVEAVSQFGGATAMAVMGFMGALSIAAANPNLSKVQIKNEWWKRFSGSIGKYDDAAKRLFRVAKFSDGRQLPLYGEQITPKTLKEVNAAVAKGDAKVSGLSYDQVPDAQKLEVINYVEAKQRAAVAPETMKKGLALEALPEEERAAWLGVTLESEAQRTVREQTIARMAQRNQEIRDEQGNLKPGVVVRTVPADERARLAGIAGKTYRDIGNLDPADQTMVAQIEAEDGFLRSLRPPEAAKLNDAEFDVWRADRRTKEGKWQPTADAGVTRAHAEKLRETVEALIARGDLDGADRILTDNIGTRPEKIPADAKKQADAFDVLVKDLKKQVQDARGKPAEAVVEPAPAMPPELAMPGVPKPAEQPLEGASEAYIARERARIERALAGNRARLQDKNLRPEARKAAEAAVAQLEVTLEQMDAAIEDMKNYQLGGPDWMAGNEQVEEIIERHRKEIEDYERGGGITREGALPVDVQEEIRRLALEGLPPTAEPEAYQLVLDSLDRAEATQPAATVPAGPRLSSEERKRIADNVMNWFWRPAQESGRPLTPDEVNGIADDVRNYYLGGPPWRAPEELPEERRRHTPDELERIAKDVGDYWRGGPGWREPGPPRRMNAEERQAVADRARERAEQARGRPITRIVPVPRKPAVTLGVVANPVPEDVQGIVADLHLEALPPPPTEVSAAAELRLEEPPVPGRDEGYLGAPVVGHTGRMDVRGLDVIPGKLQFKKGANPKTGATDSLDAIKAWDPGAAGVIAVWWNPETEKFTVVNGHTRLAAAKRFGIKEVNVLRIEAVSIEDAYAYGALINIGEGQGTVFDAATYFRLHTGTEAERLATLERHGLNLEKPLVQQALGLARLDERLFEMAVNDDPKLKPKRAAAIGRLTADPVEQWAIFEEIVRREKRPGAYVNIEEIETLYRLAKQAGKTKKKGAGVGQTGFLFPSTEQEKNLLMTMSQEVVHQRQRLVALRAHYAAVSDEARAKVLAGLGNKNDWERNQSETERVSREIEIYDKEFDKSGTIVNILAESARRIEGDENANAIEIRNATHDAIRKAAAEIIERSVRSAGEKPEGDIGGRPAGERALPPTLTVAEFERALLATPQGRDSLAVAHIFADSAGMSFKDWVAGLASEVRLGGTYWDKLLQDRIARGDLEPGTSFEEAAKRFPEFQGMDAKIVRGMAEFIADGRAIIHIFNTADGSTALHEITHAAYKYLPAEDRAAVDRWLDSLNIKDPTERAEVFTRAAERYRYEGKAPTAELQPVFARIAAWMREIYTGAKEALLIKPNAEVEQVLERMHGGKGERGKAEAKVGPLEPLPPEAPKAVHPALEEVTEAAAIFKKAFGARPAMQAEAGTRRFQLEAVPGERKPEPEIARAAEKGLRVGRILDTDQIPSRSWISPSGNFAEVTPGKTHDGVAHQMGTTSLSLMKAGWIRKPGEGYYEVYQAVPDVLRVIQQDMDATPYLLDDPRSVIYIDQARIIGQPHTIRITGADYVQANYDLTEAVGQRFQFPNMQLLQGEGLDPELLKSAIIIGMDQYKAGRRDFASWSQHFIDEYGEKARPYLDAAWRGMPALARARAEQVVKAHPEAKARTEADVGSFRAIEEATREEKQDQEAAQAARKGKAQIGAAAAPGRAPAGGGREQPGGEVGGYAPVGTPGSPRRTDLVTGAGIEKGLQKKIQIVGEPPPSDESMVPKEMVPHLTNFQRQGAASAIRAMFPAGSYRGGGYLLADGTGTGKSLVALAVAKYAIDHGHPVLIASMPEVFSMYAKDVKPGGTFGEWLERFGLPSARYVKPNAKGEYTKRFEPGKLYFATFTPGFNHAPVDSNTVLIIDESHGAKNEYKATSQTSRGVVVADFARRAHAVMFMSATPIDMPQQITYLERAGILEGRSTREAYESLGLKSKTVTVHSKWGDIDKEVWYVDPNVGARGVNKRLDALTTRMIGDGKMLKRELSMDGVNVNILDVPVSQRAREISEDIEYALRGQTSVAGTGLEDAIIRMHQRRQFENDKIDHVINIVRKRLAGNPNEKFVLFMARTNESQVMIPKTLRDPITGERIKTREPAKDRHGNDIISPGTTAALKKRLVDEGIVKAEDIAEIHGEAEEEFLGAKGQTRTRPKDNKTEMARFQTGKVKVVIATIESGGTGINLDDVTGKNPRTMIIITAPFSAVQNMQAVGRVWRLSTQSHPEIFYLRGDIDIDHWNFGIIQNKMATLGAVVKGEAPRLDPAYMESQALLYQSERGKRGEEKPGPLMAMIPGMEDVLREQQATKDKIQGEELTAQFAGKISTKGRPEAGPLFRGTEAAPQRELFGLEALPEEKPTAKTEPQGALFQEDLEMPKSLEGPSQGELNELRVMDVTDARRLMDMLRKMGPRANRGEVLDTFLKRSKEQMEEQGRVLDAAAATVKGGAARARAEEEMLPPAGGGTPAPKGEKAYVVRLEDGSGCTFRSLRRAERFYKERLEAGESVFEPKLTDITSERLSGDIATWEGSFRSQNLALGSVRETRPIAEKLEFGIDDEYTFKGIFMRLLAEADPRYEVWVEGEKGPSESFTIISRKGTLVDAKQHAESVKRAEEGANSYAETLRREGKAVDVRYNEGKTLEGLGLGGHGWFGLKKFLEIGDILDRFENPLEAIGERSVRFRRKYDPDLAQRAAVIRSVLDEIWEMLPEKATREGGKAGFIKNYLTHMERIASSNNDLMAGIQQVWDYHFRKPLDDILAPWWSWRNRRRQSYEHKIQMDAEGHVIRDKAGRPVYLRPPGMGKPGSPYVEHRGGFVKNPEMDVRRVLPAYVDSIARVIFRKPIAEEVAKMIRQLPEDLPIGRELAESTLRNYTRYDVYREMERDWERSAYSFMRITGRSMVGGKLAIQTYHACRFLLNTFPELKIKYSAIGVGRVLRNPVKAYDEMGRLGMMQISIRPAKFRLPTQALDNALGYFYIVDGLERAAAYHGFRQKFLDAGMDELQASREAIREVKRVSAFIDPVRSIGIFTEGKGAVGVGARFGLQFKHQVARLVEQYAGIILKARQDPARFFYFMGMAALVYEVQGATGLKLWHIGPYMLNFAGAVPGQITKIAVALWEGNVEKAVEETGLWLIPGGLSARHEWQGIKKEGLMGLSAVRKHEPWFERGATFMRQQPAIRGPLEETFGLKHVKPRRQSARERLGLEPLPLERMEMPQ